jgi:hypothetical protein
MKKKIILFFTMMIFCFLVLVNPGFSGDLDDGMSKYTDDGITKYDDLGDPEKNIKFIKLNAKSRAEVKSRASGGDSGGSTDASAGANMNSVVLGAGGIIKGDVYIIDESRGDKTQVVDK